MSTKSVKTRAYDDLRLIRRARPYRMAVIELNFASGNIVSYRYIFNEFGNLVSSFSRSQVGEYTLTVTPDSFKNKNNVGVEVYMNVNSLSPFVLVLPNVSTNISLDTIKITIIDASFVPTDFEGKILVTIKEYY